MKNLVVFLVLVLSFYLAAAVEDGENVENQEILETAEGAYGGFRAGTGFNIGHYGGYRPFGFGHGNIQGYFRPYYGGFHGKTFGYHGYKPYLGVGLGYHSFGSLNHGR